MTSIKIDADQLSNEMSDLLRTFNGKVSESVEFAASQAASEAISIIRSGSATPRNNGDYAKSWTKKKLSDASYVVYSKKPNLPHLLEKGHLIVSYGKKHGRTKARPHIKPAEEKSIARFEEILKHEIQKG